MGRTPSTTHPVLFHVKATSATLLTTNWGGANRGEIYGDNRENRDDRTDKTIKTNRTDKTIRKFVRDHLNGPKVLRS